MVWEVLEGSLGQKEHISKHKKRKKEGQGDGPKKTEKVSVLGPWITEIDLQGILRLALERPLERVRIRATLTGSDRLTEWVQRPKAPLGETGKEAWAELVSQEYGSLDVDVSTLELAEKFQFRWTKQCQLVRHFSIYRSWLLTEHKIALADWQLELLMKHMPPWLIEGVWRAGRAQGAATLGDLTVAQFDKCLKTLDRQGVRDRAAEHVAWLRSERAPRKGEEWEWNRGERARIEEKEERKQAYKKKVVKMLGEEGLVETESEEDSGDSDFDSGKGARTYGPLRGMLDFILRYEYEDEVPDPILKYQPSTTDFSPGDDFRLDALYAKEWEESWWEERRMRNNGRAWEKERLRPKIGECEIRAAKEEVDERVLYYLQRVWDKLI
jgi:hypothetical protein